MYLLAVQSQQFCPDQRYPCYVGLLTSVYSRFPIWRVYQGASAIALQFCLDVKRLHACIQNQHTNTMFSILILVFRFSLALRKTLIDLSLTS